MLNPIFLFHFWGHIFPFNSGISTPSRPAGHGHAWAGLLSGAEEEILCGRVELNTQQVSGWKQDML